MEGNAAVKLFDSPGYDLHFAKIARHAGKDCRYPGFLDSGVLLAQAGIFTFRFSDRFIVFGRIKKGANFFIFTHCRSHLSVESEKQSNCLTYNLTNCEGWD